MMSEAESKGVIRIVQDRFFVVYADARRTRIHVQQKCAPPSVSELGQQTPCTRMTR